MLQSFARTRVSPFGANGIAYIYLDIFNHQIGFLYPLWNYVRH